MKRNQVVIIMLVFIVILVGGLVYNYTFNSKHRDIANEEAIITLSAKELYSHFEKDEALAITNYLDRVIELDGQITSVEDTEIVLDNRIQVSFNPKIRAKVSDGASLRIKGRCVGYDELLELVKIDQATIINK